ncbi:FtsX-like permease family protein [Nonomuraea soli]|uniref:Putative ABC transport system permease protein n=1 Tax=Nonomuraea soli TaxID=1032476 RepID=A0A7W0CDA7_9ACTN|nr:FtsX-like permease family protein [Nonomuraea soli]MBA2889047.1 putative ABC transport system permease protein [Nonomuraea soli]
MNSGVLARVHAGAVAVLALLTLSATLLVSGLPRAMNGAFDDALSRKLDSVTAREVDLSVRFQPGSGNGLGMRDRSAFEQRDRLVRSELPRPLSAIVRPPGSGTSHMSLRTLAAPVMGAPDKYLDMGWMSDAAQRIEWVGGAPPGPPRASGGMTLVEIGVTQHAVEKMGLALGSEYVVGATKPLRLKVTGVFKAKQPDSAYWTHHPDMLRAAVSVKPGTTSDEFRYTALIADASVSTLADTDRQVVYSWILGLDTAAVSSLRVGELLTALQDYRRDLGLIEPSWGSFRLDSLLGERLTEFRTELATAETILFLVLGGLLLVALGVIVLAAQLLLERMDQALALMRARGGALATVVRTGLAPIALSTVPAALAGYALSYLVPGPATPIVHIAPLLVLLTVLAFSAVMMASAHRTPLHERRGDVVSPKPSPRRITLEILVIGLALGGAYLLRTRGVTTEVSEQGQDPFLLLVPMALTVAAALITLRCYPYPLRLVVRLAARRRPAVPFLGLTRAARAKAFSVLPVLILLPALGVSVFASMMATGLDSTQKLAAWQRVGVPIKLTTELEFSAEAIERVREVAGVQEVLPAQTGIVQLGLGAQRFPVLAVDLAGFARIAEGSPVPLPAQPAGQGIPALVSKELKGVTKLDIGWQTRMTLTPAGELAAMPGFFSSGKFAVVPYDANERAGTRVAPNVLLVKGAANAQALLAATGVATQIQTYDQIYSEIADDPLTSVIRTTLLVATIAMAVYACVAVIVSLVISAADRADALSFLRTLGLSTGQAQRLTVLEVSPLILITALVGLGLGLALPSALGPGVDLSAYAGDVAVGAYEVDLLTPILLAAGLTLVAILGALVHTIITRRRTLGSVLRVGD